MIEGQSYRIVYIAIGGRCYVEAIVAVSITLDVLSRDTDPAKACRGGGPPLIDVTPCCTFTSEVIVCHLPVAVYGIVWLLL